MQWANKRLFDKVKSILPKISDTELIALRSGTTSMDRDIFKGKVNYPPRVEKPEKFYRPIVSSLIRQFEHVDKIYPNKESGKYMREIASRGMFSFIIDEKYGGTQLSVSEMSSILTRISSANPALGVVVMVPNSLGPAELLQHYGTEKQKNTYLPGLAKGDLVPCFGLTGPHNGSDATGSIDEGTVVKGNDGKKYIEVTINKRYITLAPVANLIGLAIRVTDKDNLLESGKEGVTLALVKKGHPGLLQDTHHNPLNVGFPNGTLKGTLKIPVEDVIGGEEQVGNGWKMLMECLAAGRGICLPAAARASSKSAFVGIYTYARHRKQFNRSLLSMEGVQQKVVDMLYHTWIIETSVALTNNILDSGEKPAVISAIMKQQTTDRAREVLNHAMDIHAGSAICLGPNNFLEKFYRSAPIGITVEGSNTLTKSLIIFGQGLNKSHPHIFPVLESIMNNDEQAFATHMQDIVKHTLTCYKNAMVHMITGGELARQTAYFACLANFVALYGGSLKSRQMLSADMADILSNLYLAHSVVWYHRQHHVSKILTNHCIDRLCRENTRLINRVIDNLHMFYPLLRFMKTREDSYLYSQTTNIIKELTVNQGLHDHILKDVQLNNTPLENIIYIGCKDDYKKNYDKMIQVGEYDNVTTDP